MHRPFDAHIDRARRRRARSPPSAGRRSGSSSPVRRAARRCASTPPWRRRRATSAPTASPTGSLEAREGRAPPTDGQVGGRACRGSKEAGAVLTAPTRRDGRQDPAVAAGRRRALRRRPGPRAGGALDDGRRPAGAHQAGRRARAGRRRARDRRARCAGPLPRRAGQRRGAGGRRRRTRRRSSRRGPCPRPTASPSSVATPSARPARAVAGALDRAIRASRSTPTSGGAARDLLLLDQGASRVGRPAVRRAVHASGPSTSPASAPAELAVDLRDRGGAAGPARRRLRPRWPAPSPPTSSSSSPRTLEPSEPRREPGRPSSPTCAATRGGTARAAVWLVAMLALPVVRARPARRVLRRRRRGPAAARARRRTDPATDGVPDGSATGPAAERRDRSRGDAHHARTVAGRRHDDPHRRSSSSCRPRCSTSSSRRSHPIVFPPLPEELRTLAAGIAPIAAYGCSGVGLASLVVSVVSQTVEGVPLGRLLPYLTPVERGVRGVPDPAGAHRVRGGRAARHRPRRGDSTPPILGPRHRPARRHRDAMSPRSAISVPQPRPRAARPALDCRVVGKESPRPRAQATW